MVVKATEVFKLWRNRRLPLKELQLMRSKKLRLIVNHAYQNVPFYRRLFDSVNLSPQDIKTTDDIVKLPVVQKDDFRRAGYDQIMAKGFTKESCSPVTTSGSYGKPFATYRSRREFWLRRLLGARRLVDAGVNYKDRTAVICDARQYPFKRHNTKFIAALLSMDEQLKILQSFKPTVLKIWPTTLRIWLHNTNYRLNEFIKPRIILVSGEICEDSLRAKVKECMGLDLFNAYATGEFGPVANECRFHHGLHTNDDQLIVECLKDGQPAKEDQIGEVVITSLFGFAMPFIRYSLGDLAVKIDGPCQCGSSFSRIGPIVGRKNDVIVLANGKILCGGAVAAYIMRYAQEVYQFRLIQEELDSFVLKVVFLSPPSEGVLSKIRKDLLGFVGQSAKLDIEVVDFIPEEPGRKFKLFISKVKSPDHLDAVTSQQ